MAYADTNDIQERILRTLTENEIRVCTAFLDDAAAIVDAYNENASEDAKKIVSCRMVIRALGDGGTSDIPIGASQGSMSGLGYSQSWTIGGNGAAGELYLSKLEKKLLGSGNLIGSRSPIEMMSQEEES